jgi:hypothetical protein
MAQCAKQKHRVICRVAADFTLNLIANLISQGSGLHSCHGGGWIALIAFAGSHRRSHLADAHGNNHRAYKQ